jgi:hypothetical protein
VRVTTLQRSDFLENYWSPNPGEHANWICPTGGGKSYFMNQCVEKFMDRYPDLSYVTLAPKPDDETTSEWAKKLGYKATPDWPPKKRWFEEKPRGYVLWPNHNIEDEQANREHLNGVFSRAFNRQYGQGNSVTIADDAYALGVLYGMNQLFDRHWVNGRSLGASLYSSLQKPSGTVNGAVSSFAYSAPVHLFLGKDTDERNLKRFGEIGASGIDPDDLRRIVYNLPVHRFGTTGTVSDFLYIDRRGPYIAQVTP